MRTITFIVSGIFATTFSAFGQIGPAPTPSEQPVPEVVIPSAPAVQPEAPSEPPVLPVPDGTPVNRKELEGGLITEDLRVGTGPEVTATSNLVVHYQGVRRTDLKEFASTYARNEPFAQQLPQALKGWRDGLPGMRVGGVRRLYVPAAMAYGEKGHLRKSDQLVLVKPNEDVIFTVEVVDTLQVEDVKVGDGETIEGRFIAIGPFTIKDESGKVLEEATREKPFIWVHGEYQPMDLALEGMKVGGIRRITVPRQFALAKGLGMGHPTHKKLVIEFELLQYRCIDLK